MADQTMRIKCPPWVVVAVVVALVVCPFVRDRGDSSAIIVSLNWILHFIMARQQLGTLSNYNGDRRVSQRTRVLPNGKSVNELLLPVN